MNQERKTAGMGLPLLPMVQVKGCSTPPREDKPHPAIDPKPCLYSILYSLKSLSLAMASKTREAPMRLERAAERVAANTPRVIRGA